MAADGHIVLSTKIDTSGVGKGVRSIKDALEKLKNSFKSLGKAQTEAFNVENKEALARIDEIKKKLAELDEEETKLYEKQQALAESYIPDVDNKDLFENFDPTKAMTDEDLKVYDDLSNKISDISTKINSLKAELEELGDVGEESGEDVESGFGEKLESAVKKVGDSFKALGKKIASTAKRLLIYQTIYKVMKALIDLMKNILMSDKEFRQDWEELKAALITAAQPLINIIVPALKTIVSIVRDWAVSIGRIAAALSGMTYKQYVEQAKATKQSADNFADMEDSAKKTEKTLAGFDDIQILSSGKSDESSNDYSGFDSLMAAEDADPASEAQTMLQAILSAVGGLLAGIGLMLLTNGQIKWGLAFVIAGAAFWAISKISEGTFSEDPVVNVLAKIMAIAGTMLVALGLILIVFGQIPWGLAALAVGIVAIVTAVALSSDGIVEMIRGPLGIIMAIAGTALLVLGIILVCTGVALPLGIALIVAGAALLVTTVVVNKDAILDVIKSVWNGIKKFWNTYIYPGLKTPIKIVKDLFYDIFETIKKYIRNIKSVFQGIMKFIKSVFKGDWKSAWEAIGEIFSAVWETFKGIVTGVLNVIIDGLNFFWAQLYKAIAGVVNGVGSIIEKFGDLLGKDDWGFSIPKDPPLIPRLAQGAVIPANREFMAVLGDQKNGRNLETPEGLMRQIFREELDSAGGRTNSNSNGSTTVILEVDGREFGRAVYEYNNKESRRIGTRLVTI